MTIHCYKTFTITGWKEPMHGCARFSIHYHGTNIHPAKPAVANTDWPTAWKFLVEHGERDPETILQLALVGEK